MDKPPTRILAVDDNPEALFTLAAVLSQAGFHVRTASDGAAAFENLAADTPDLIISDVNMPRMDGYELTRRLKGDPVYRFIPVILVTARDGLEDVMEGLQLGANDYIKKPYQSAELLARVRAAIRTREIYLELRDSEERNRELSARVGGRFSVANIIGESAAMQQVFDLIDKIKDAEVPVLISGESGTGKELVASALHYQSPRRHARLLVQNCSAFNENLLESELFGHVRGAFTNAHRDKPGLFEAADGGTFFLDELGEMSPALQAKLLRVLQDGSFIPVGGTQEKKVNVRVLAATNRDLLKMVEEGKFREDLYYRLNVINMRLPALRERRSDILLLAEHFLARIAAKTGKDKKVLSPDALAALARYRWPGNIRELQNEIERMVLLSGSAGEIGLEVVSPQIAASASEPAGAPEGTVEEAVQALEARMIRDALTRFKGNKSEASRVLGISRSSLISKVKLYGIE